tara:strand:+ start:1551 stop:1946 length:396 start_codon:yes stop_codon:yes gene_type:complete
MYQRRPRRFRRRSNQRNHLSQAGGNPQARLRSNSFTNGQHRNNFKNTLSAEKLFEKYSNLAKEALTSGDKTLSENYLQHADHFMRVIEDKNKNRAQINQIKSESVTKSETSEDKSTNITSINQNNIIKNKE